MAETKRTIDRLFPPGMGRERWYGLGRQGEWLNRPPREIGVVKPAAGIVQFLGATSAQLQDHDPDSRYTPSHINGDLTLDGAGDSPVELAVAVNGTVRVETRTFERKRKALRFSAFVPPRFFRAGYNEVEVYVISRGKDGAVALTPTEQQGGSLGRFNASYRLVSENGGEVIQGPKALRVRVVPGALEGWVDQRKKGNKWVRFRGWAFDREADRPAETLLLFVDGQFVTSATTGKIRSDVAAAKGAAARTSGFAIYVRDSLAGSGCMPKVRVFALSERGTAGELKYNPAYRCDR